MSIRIGSLLVSLYSRRRARVVGLTGSQVCLEFSPGRTQWRRLTDIQRLYRTV